jgi:hypothetical protein
MSLQSCIDKVGGACILCGHSEEENSSDGKEAMSESICCSTAESSESSDHALKPSVSCEIRLFA